MPNLPGQRLVTFKPLELADVDKIMTWVNDPEVVGNFANFDHSISREEELHYIERMLASDTDKVFSVFSEQDEYIGQAGLHQIYWPSRNGRAGLMIRREFQNRGYGQKAMGEMLRIAFEDYGLHKAWLIVREANEKARHVYEKCGFKVEGLLRDEYLLIGQYHNMIRMSILEHEFRQRLK